MSESMTYRVPGMTCEHCKAAVAEELSAVDGVAHVSVNLESKLVEVSGKTLDDTRLRVAIQEAGYEAA